MNVFFFCSLAVQSMVMLLRGMTKTIPTRIVQVVAIASDIILKISEVMSVSSTLRWF